jgi:glutamate dehydrogenase (NAD(P)+)
MSAGELEKLTRRYTAGIMSFLGPDSDVPAPDVNTNERIMAWLMDTYSMHVRHTVTAITTGKPVVMGGSLGRREATGRGCMITTRSALKKLGMSIKGARVAVQGFGNVGSISAMLMAEQGMKVIAVSDHTGGIYDKKGLNVKDLMEWTSKHRSLEGYKKGEKISNAELLVSRLRRAGAGRAGEPDHRRERGPHQGARDLRRAPTVPPPPPPIRSSTARGSS